MTNELGDPAGPLSPRGGHFPAYEEPELLADDITAFFRTVISP
jgi:hypothetical protein